METTFSQTNVKLENNHNIWQTWEHLAYLYPEKTWEVAGQSEKQSETIRDSRKNEKQSETMRSNVKQWETMRNHEKHEEKGTSVYWFYSRFVFLTASNG